MNEKNQKEKRLEAEVVPGTLKGRLHGFWRNVFLGAVVVAAFFGGLELALALFGVDPVLVTEDPFVGFAKNIPLFVEERQPDGSILLKTAQNKWNWFNRDQAFPKKKGPGTYRIFCMGESTTYGYPYYDRVSFCGWLRAYLRAADPSRHWEVINAGGISYASYRVAKLMEELKKHKPDLFIVYSGQNEFLEERSYEGLRKLPAGALRVSGVLSRTRTWAVMEKAIEIVRPNPLEDAKERYELSGEVDEILKYTVGPTSYRRDDAFKGQIVKHYRLGLERMVQIARKAGADIIFVQPAVNLKNMSPFKSEHKEGLGEAALAEWEALYRRAEALQKEGRLSEALGFYYQALEIDDRYAELHFRIGQLLFETGAYDQAEQAFWRAVDEDVAPLRILTSMQRIVEEVAADKEVPLIDFPRVLKDAYIGRYGHTIFGKEFFVSHVHPSIEGYRLLGLALLDEMIQRKIAAPAPSWSAEAVERVNKEVLSGIDREAEGLAMKNLGKTFNWVGKFDEAQPLFLRAVEILGPDPEIYQRLGTYSILRRSYDEAIFYFNQVSVLEPDWPDVHHQLARLSAAKGKIEEAIEHFREELRRYPNNHVVHTELAVLLTRKGENREARRHFGTALELAPDFESAHLNLAILSDKEKRDEEVLAHSREVLRLNPDQPLAHIYIGVILKRQGKIEEAIHHLSEAVRLNPDNPAAQKHLREALADRL